MAQRASLTLGSWLQKLTIDHLYENLDAEDVRLYLHQGELPGAATLRRVADIAKPDEVKHLAPQSDGPVSFDVPQMTLRASTRSIHCAFPKCRPVHGV